MLTAGRISLIQDDVIKAQSRRYVLLRERARAYYQEAVNELFRLHSRFPALIKIRRTPIESDNDVLWGGLAGDGFKWSPDCNTEKMRASTAFLNEYADNLSRINSQSIL